MILVYLPGGPSHLDMYDAKPDSAPIEMSVESQGHDETGSDASDGGGGGGGGGGGDGGGGGSGEEGSGDGDGEPPISAGLAFDGDGQHAFWIFLLLIFVCFDNTLRLLLSLPVQVVLGLYRCIPPLPRIWDSLQYVFPDRVRFEVYLRSVRTLQRDYRLAERKGRLMRAWILFWLRARTALLVAVCVVETIKDIPFSKEDMPGLT